MRIERRSREMVVMLTGAVPFLVITGTFHLIGRTPAGNPSG
jgi:hypothetical protein